MKPLAKRSNSRQRLLVVNFFPAFVPPTSGGEQRYYYLYRHLSQQFDVTLLSPTYPGDASECVEHSDAYREYRIPKPAAIADLHQQLDKGNIGPECSAVAVAMMYAVDDVFACVLDKLAVGMDAIVHEFPYTLPHDRGFGNDGIPRIYNSHNVEHKLASQILSNEIGARAVDMIRDLEHHLVAGSDLVFATCEEERQTFISDFGVSANKVKLAPNGFEPDTSDISEAASSTHKRHDREVVFMGSAHPPNIEALRFIADHIAPELSDVTFNIMGKVGTDYDNTVPANVNLLGLVSDSEKECLLNSCTAAVNPLFSGAGTNLKMLDYMAHGAPLVTTQVGARGLSLIDGEHAIVCEPEAFIESLSALLDDAAMRETIAKETKRLVVGRYSWGGIASNVGNELQSLLEKERKRNKRPKLVVLCDYPVDDPKGGGQARIAALLTQLGREYEIVFLCLSDEAGETRRLLAPHVVQWAIPKTPEQRGEEAQMQEGEAVSIGDILSGKHCARNARLVGVLDRVAVDASAIIFEHCYLAPLLNCVPDDQPVIYSSHNVETVLKRELLAQRNDGPSWLPDTSRWENALLDRAQLVVTVSEEDATYFRKNRPALHTLVIRNGARASVAANQGGLARTRPDWHAGRRLKGIFIGSAHPPNVEAARIIKDEIALRVPHVCFQLIGSVCNALRGEPMPPNVVLYGVVSEGDKQRALQQADFAINPMLCGGGSSLKIADYFVAGLPVISTDLGVRGFPIQAGEHYFSAKRDGFADIIATLAQDPARRQAVADAAQQYAVRELLWSSLGRIYRRRLTQLLSGKAPTRVLVLTYRFTTPERGGAEAYLLNTLQYLHEDSTLSIDVVSPELGSIQDDMHFSAAYGPREATDKTPLCAENVHYFPLNARGADLQDDIRKLFSLWASESLQLGRRISQRLDGAYLLGGWNDSENHGDGPVCWMSAQGEVHIPAHAKQITISGSAPKKLTLELLQGDTLLGDWNVNNAFSIHTSLAESHAHLVIKASGLIGPETDLRPLSILVDGIEFECEDATHAVDLSMGLEGRARQSNADAWLHDLIAVTNARSEEQDALFCKVRGPHSAELTQWLEKHISDYDVVLAQGVPFATSVLGVSEAGKYKVPVVVLPHYHMHDRYYHWRSFYDAFRKATNVIAVNAGQKSFFNNIGARSTVMAGGGVNSAEFTTTEIERGRAAFRRLHRRRTPFVLVLGRKVGGKNYKTVIDSVGKTRAIGKSADMVMIGPDDDGEPVRSTSVYYYGAQPRRVVIGALAEASCLANMSTSESFGIVLLEAWLAGTPVVAAESCAAFAELVIHGNNGYLAKNSSELAEAVQQYIEKPLLADEHAERGRKLARTYTWSALAQQIKSALIQTAKAGCATTVRWESSTPQPNVVTLPSKSTVKELDTRSRDADTPRSVINTKSLVQAAVKQSQSGVVHDTDFKILKQFIRPNTDVLDVGGTRGQSIISLRLISPHCRIVSFEANPLLHPAISRIAELNDVTFFGFGLGDINSECPLYIPKVENEYFLEEASIRRDYFDIPWVAEKYAARGDLELYTVDISIRVGDELKLQPSVIKVDVEGAELRVLKGLQGTLAKYHPALLVENSDYENVTEFLESHGYSPYMISGDTFTPLTKDCTNALYLTERAAAGYVTIDSNVEVNSEVFSTSAVKTN